MNIPIHPKIYHIMPLDRLDSVLDSGYIYSDYLVRRHGLCGTTIGMSDIKDRRLGTAFRTYPSLVVGQCVPFYFCPRSVMLYVLSRRNHPSLSYRGGQESIIHLEADLKKVIAWADTQGRKWLCTPSNAGSFYFEEYVGLSNLDKLDWDAIQASDWHEPENKEHKQAEFLLEEKFPVSLIERIGVYSESYGSRALTKLNSCDQRPIVEVKKDWYY